VAFHCAVLEFLPEGLFAMRKLSLSLLVAALVVMLPTLALAWGDNGHTAINHAAAVNIPSSMPGFLKAADSHITFLGPEPDRWRSNLERALNDAQAPDHFIDLEYVDWMKTLPADRYRFIAAVYEYRNKHPEANVPQPERIGFQPYITIEVFDRLKVALREYRHAKAEGRSTADAEADAIFYAGWLGHYVGDGSNPMHTSVQYNGWTGPNPKGYSTAHDVHSKMETHFVNANPEVTKIEGLLVAPRHLEHPFEDYLAYLRASQGEIEHAYQLERDCGFEGHGTPESRDFIRHRLAAGAQMLLDMWYTAWVDSAQDPEPWRGEKREPRQCVAPKSVTGGQR
jgi:hypothetical protein